MDTSNYKRVDPKAKKYWIINGIIASVVLIVIAWVAIYFAKEYLWFFPLIIAIVISFLVIIVHPTIEYKQWGYYIGEDRIAYTHGIYNRKNIVIPISKIQHLNISQGPIQKHFGLANLEVYTAGSVCNIEAILFLEAESIVDNLNSYIANNSKNKL